MGNPSLTKRFNALKPSKALGDLDMTPEQAERLREAQLASVQDLTTIIVMAGLLNTFVIMIMFGTGALGNLFSLWAMSQCAVMGYIIFNRIRAGDRPHKASLDERTRGYVRGASILGFLWAIIPLMTFPVGDDVQFAATGIILTATLFGSVLLIGRLPDAAMAFTLPILGGMLAALQLQQDPRNGLLTVLTLVYGGMLYFGARLAYAQFAKQQLGQDALEDQTQVIGLLLRDFEENASDTLWQCDEQGRIADVPEILQSETEGGKWAKLIGESFVHQFLNTSARQDLNAKIKDRSPFKDLKLQACDSKKWWAVTGKPVFEAGVFKGYRGVIRDITQAQEIEHKISFMAHHDDLTGLPNRNKFSQILTDLSKSEARQDRTDFIAWLDLDRFKWINDTLGHDFGDQVLKAVAKRLREYTDGNGAVARLSGDEFAILFSMDEFSDVQQQVDTLIEALSVPYSVWGSSVMCRATAGVKVLNQGFFDTEQVMKHADTALNQAKQSNRGGWCMFDHSMEEKIRSDRQLESDLNRAVENDELKLYFQPIVDATTKLPVACETLMRWQHPQKGLLGPGAFIPFAEENGLITRIGAWVIRNAIREAARMPDDIRVAINISPIQIHSEDLIPTLVNALATHNVAPSRIELEITESVMISDAKFTMERLRQLKEIGVRIALDDFGTGFSSLSYLRQFPFDKLKIDKCFTEQLEIDADSRAITKATLSLAKALNIRCTGEGIETQGQADFLREHGCDELQGFMYSRPQPLERLAHMIELKAPSNEAGEENVVSLGGRSDTARKQSERETQKTKSA